MTFDNDTNRKMRGDKFNLKIPFHQLEDKTKQSGTSPMATCSLLNQVAIETGRPHSFAVVVLLKDFLQKKMDAHI